MKTSRHFRKLWVTLLVIALCLSAIPVLAMGTEILEPEGGVGTREYSWTLADGGAEYAITVAGQYGLTGDVIGVTTPFYIGTEEAPVDVVLDLYGHTITSAARAFIVCPGSSLTIKDSVGGGQVQGAEVADNEQGGVIRVDSGATLTLQGGSIVDVAEEAHQSDGGAIAAISGTVNIEGGEVKGGTAYFGGSIYMVGGALNISGGVIDGGTATNESAIPYGGAVYVKDADFAMTGGTITGGYAVSETKCPGGGNLFLNASDKTFTISGGTITGGKVDNGNGGNIYVSAGTLDISGDALIEGGYAARDTSRNNGGGNIYMANGAVLNISGGTIKNGTYANSYGGNIFTRGDTTISGGLIEGGSAVNGGNIFISGYDSAKTLTISGGTIQNGSIADGTKKDETTIVAGSVDGTGTYNGENIYANSAVVAVSDGTIIDDDGGNAILAFTKLASSPATVRLSLATNDETAADLDGKIYLVTGAVISTDRGTTVSNDSGDQIWRDMAYADAAGMAAMGGTVKGTYNTGNGQETVYEGVTADEFAAYEKALVEAGYTLYSSNALAGTSVDGNNTPLSNEFRIYVSDTKVINLSYHSADGRTFVIVEDKENAYLPLTSTPVYETVCDPLITQVGSEDLTLLESPPADYSQENDMCYIMRLSDGTFFIIDSAETATAERIYDVLKKQAIDPENIVISGWIITHPHSDHYRGFRKFAELYADDPTITLKEIIYNFAAAANITEAHAKAQENIKESARTGFPEAKHSFVHTGNILRHADMELMVMYTQEDFIAANNGVVCNVNGTSLVSRMVFKGGSSVFVPADHPTDGYSSGGTWCENKLEIWYGTGLKSDISTTFHHGFNGGAHEQIYYTIAPDIVLWCADYQRIADQSTWDHARNSYFCADSAPKSFAYMARENLTVVNLKDGYPFVDYYAAATAYTGTPAYTEAPEPTEPTEPTEPEVNNFCPHCQKEVEWTEWTGGNITSTSLHGGHHHYRLTKSTVSGTSQIKVGVASTAVFEICIDMNGNQIAKTSRAFAIYGGTTVNLVNTTTKESAVKGAYKAAAGGVINLDGASNLRLYDGVHLYSTAADNAFPYNAGVVQVNSGTFTMLGGKITGRRVLNGGAVLVKTGVFNMKGGTITGGNAIMTSSSDTNPQGGNVYISSGGTVNLSGGTIENGSAAGVGGNIYIASGGTLNITGGIVGSSASADNIYAKGTVNLTLADAANETALALDGQILGESTATITANVGVVQTLESGNKLWVISESGATEPTEPSTEATEPSTEATEPSTEPTEPETTLCPHCQKEVVWTDWTGGNITDTDLHGGHHHYRLTKASVTGSSQIQVGVKDSVAFEICIDLNGNNINKTSRAFAIYNGTTVNLVNTSETESAVKGAYKAAAAGVINLDGASNLRLYDGVSLSSTAAADAFPKNAGVVQVNSGTFTMLGGTITGRRVLNGGAVYVNTGVFDMQGGTITGGNAVMTSTSDTTPQGGNVYIEANGTMNMSGGIIENGSAAFGGNIFVEEGGTLNITGGIIRNGTSTDTTFNSDNICAYGAVNVSGGEISDDNGGIAIVTDTTGAVTLTLQSMENATAIALDGLVTAINDATITADVGTVETAEDGTKTWRNITPEPEYVPGDYTGDGVVTNDDVVALLWHSLFPEENPLEISGDLNGDGEVTNEDVIKLLWYSLFPEDNPL